VDDPFATGWLSHPTLWFFLQAGSLTLFGDDVAGMRTLSALLGTATVPAVYLLGRAGWGRDVGLVAAALLTAYHLHLHYSRIALNNVADPLFVVLGFAALLHGLRSGSALSFAASGVALGLAQHFYFGARFAPLVALAVVAVTALRRRSGLLVLARRLGLGAVGFVLGMGPLLTFLLRHRGDLTARLDFVGLFGTGQFAERRAAGESGPEILLAQARDAFGAFTTVADRSSFYDPGMPLLDPVSSLLFVVGVGAALVSRCRPAGALLVAWLVAVPLLGGVLLIDPPHSPRYVAAAPAVCIALALGVGALRGLVGRLAGVRPGAAAAGAAVIVSALGLWNVHFYFRDYSGSGRFAGPQTEAATAIGRHVASLSGRPFVVFFGAPFAYVSHGSMRFLADPLDGADVIDPLAAGGELPPLPAGRFAVYVFLPERADELLGVQRAVPGGAVRRGRSATDGRLLFVAYEAPAWP
jgi:4-amino-4-deoxy-L-arabinose transferase-like glycosyltransferase